MKISQTPEDLMKHLREQAGFLRRSAKSYDEGFKDEAKRLALIIRILVHDTKNSKSVLSQLGVKDSMKFYDTAWDYNPNNLLTHNGLTAIKKSSGEAEYVAMLDDRPVPGKWVPFTSWWNRIVFKDDKGNMFTREKIVRAVADQDGGAHVDPGLDAEYVALSRENSLGVSFINDEKTIPLPAPELPAIRQISYELLKSLLKQYPEI